VLAWMIGSDMAELFIEIARQSGPVSEEAIASDPRFQDYIATSVMQWTVVQLACLAGLAGWIVSIVATATRRGRVAGIWGIVLGIVAPIAAFAVGIAAMVPALSQIS